MANIAGQVAAVICDSPSTLVHTFTESGDCRVTIRLSSIDNTPVTVKVYHVKQGQPLDPKYIIATYADISDSPETIKDLWVQRTDQIHVDVDTIDTLVVNVNKHSKE